MKPRVILVTDPAFGDDVIARCVGAAARALPRGALCVQLRDKRRGRTSLRLMAARLRAVTRRSGAWLVVNGDAVVARDADADGVHLGRGAGSVAAARAVVGDRCWVSVAAHSDSDVVRAADDGADAALVSPIFATRPPSSGAPATAKEARGLDALRSARRAAGGRIALYALGGVTPERAALCAAAGADGVAVLRVLLAAGDPGRVARALHRAFASAP